MMHYRTCSLCEAMCGVAIEVEGDRVVSIRGDADDPFSQGHICPKAVALKDLHEDPDRLRRPVRRVGERWVEIGWDEAFDEAARNLRRVQREHGRDALAVYQGNPSVHSLGLISFGQLFLRSLGTRNLYSATSADQLPHMLASLMMFGNQVLLPVPDVDRTTFMLILGGNPVVSNGSLMSAGGIERRLKALRARGGTLVVVDPRRTETAAMADEHLFIEPGTDALLLLAMIQVLFAEGRVALGRLAPHCRDLELLGSVAAPFSPEAVAAATGIGAGAIRELALGFAAAPRAVCYGRVGACTQQFGGLVAWLINALNAITGNLDQAGGAMFTTPAVALAETAARTGHAGSFGRWRSRVTGLPEFSGELPLAALADEIEQPGKGQVRALITSAGNPVLSAPNGARLDRALPTLEYMVAIDPYINETTRHAHLILPPTMPLERDHYDLALNAVAVRNIAKYSRALFPRAADQRHDWEICLELGTRILGGRLGAGVGPLGGRLARAALGRLGPRALVDLGLRAGPYGVGRGGLTVAALERQPHGVDLGPLESRLPGLLHTHDRRLHLAPQVYLDDLARLRRRLQEVPAGELRLIGRRQLRSNNSWMHNTQRLVKGPVRCTLLMNPRDAAARGLEHGQLAEVTSRAGAVRVPVEVSEEMKPGVVSLPHGWGHGREGVRLSVASEHPGASVNDLTDERFIDALSGTAAFSGVPVEVTAVP